MKPLPPNVMITLPPLPVDAVNKILAGLGFLPHRDVEALIQHIKQLGDTQVAAALDEKPQPEKAAE